jgi:hypothetical protein
MGDAVGRRSAVVTLVITATFVMAACTSAPLTTRPTPTANSAAADLDTCVVGDWTADPGLPGQFMEQLVLEHYAGFENGPTAARADGTISLSLHADGTFLYSPDIAFEIDHPIPGTQDGDVIGTATGTWQTIDGILVSNVEETDVVLRLFYGGEPEPSNGALGWEGVPIAVSEVTCEGDHLDAVFNLIDTSFPMELTRES